MNKFKVGDRVRAYCNNLAGQPCSFKGTFAATVADKPDLLCIQGDDYSLLPYSIVHYKQCRRLIKKKKSVLQNLRGYFVR